MHPLLTHPVLRGVVISVLGAVLTKAILREPPKTAQGDRTA
jgi:hypothetical protein